MSKVTNTVKQKTDTGFNEVKISYIEPNGCAAEGTGTIASGFDQHVQGRWNIEDSSYAYIVGNGTDDSNRSNMHTLDWNGSAWYQGPLVLGEENGNPENPLLKVYGDISIDGDIIANGSTLQMDKLYAIENKPDDNEHYLFNRFEETTGTMHLYPLKKDTSGELYNSTAILGIKGASFMDAYLDALTIVGRGIDQNGQDTDSRIESHINTYRKPVHYRYLDENSTDKVRDYVNVLKMTTESTTSTMNTDHERFFVDGFFGVGPFDVYNHAYFQSSISVSNTDQVGRAVLSFKTENGKKYLEISFADRDYE